MSNIPDLLQASLASDPASRKTAESNLSSYSVQPGFLPHILQIVLEPSQSIPIRQAACVYLKNQIKKRWDDEEETPVPDQDKVTIRSNIVASMVALSKPSDKLLRTQLGEGVAAIAQCDFPERWDDLITQLVASLSPNDFTVNVSVLETTHNIFSRWKSEIRSDRLYSTINYALSQFQDTYFALFRSTASHLLSGSPDPASLPLLSEIVDLLVSLFYDMTAQDIPPMFEDSNAEFFGSDVPGEDGWFLRFLQWNPKELEGDPDDPSPTAPLRVHTTILEIAELYALRYNELSSPRLPAFVRAVWELIGNSKNTVREDGVVAQAIRFLSVTVKTGLHTALFRQRETLEGLCERIIVPNMALRENEIEQFEDDPLEYIRRDLSLSAAEGGATRRHASGDLIRALISVGLEAEVTEIVQRYVANNLQIYAQNPRQNWQAKDTAIYLLTSVASLGSTTSHGVTSTNPLVDIIKFFTENVYSDLESAAHVILTVDAIRFLYTFRSQLTKEQLLSVLPLLIRHLSSENYVSYSYAAITIERILFVKRGTQLLFSQADIHDMAYPILTALFDKILSADTPDKVSENDYLMKCAMRVIITARQSLTPNVQSVITSLVDILGQISKNPSNPNFDQYCFESISALMRFVVAGNPSILPAFEATLFIPFKLILHLDVDQYIPYVLQLLAQMLELHPTSIPQQYRALLPMFLTPTVWQQKGSVPALVRLIKAYLAKDAANLIAQGQHQSILAVVQQRLIPSKINDLFGFELLQAVVTYIPPAELQKHFNVILMTLLNRLQNTRTDKYALGFAHFLCFTMAIKVEGLGPDFVINAVQAIQPGLWSSILGNIILPEVPKFQPRDRKVVAIGLTRLLTESKLMLTTPFDVTWPTTLVALLKLLLSEGITQSTDLSAASADDALSAIDFEEQTAGYQAAFAKLAASEPPRTDPVGYVQDPRIFLASQLAKAAQADPRVNVHLATVNQTSAEILTPILRLAA